jgi:predicted DCC family thiol-disulfide oxidoreductase YuxK
MPATPSSRPARRRATAALRDANDARRPGPASGDGEAVLIYDADCGFCRRSLALGRRLLPWMPEAVGFQHVDVSRYGVTEAQARRSIQLCRRGRPTRHGAAAIAAIHRAQPTRVWRIAGYALATPPLSWVAAACYRLVARYRHRLPGATCAASSSH